MRIGLVTDIHEYVDQLRQALDILRRQRVDQLVCLGDLMCLGEELPATCRLLREAGAIGVWGNHDLGLCFEPDPQILAHYPDDAVEFLATLRPRLDLGECHFCHVEPWLDPCDPAQINYYEGPPEEVSQLERIFGAVPNRLIFAGHFHRWLLATPGKIETWDGRMPIRLDQSRYYMVIGAICDGRFAILDTDTSELTPYNLR